MAVSNEQLREIAKKIGVLAYADSIGSSRHVVSVLGECLERAGGGVHVTESEEHQLYVFSKAALRESEFEMFMTAWADTPEDDSFEGRLAMRSL